VHERPVARKGSRICPGLDGVKRADPSRPEKEAVGSEVDLARPRKEAAGSEMDPSVPDREAARPDVDTPRRTRVAPEVVCRYLCN